MGKIVLLDEHTINKIAAGEVVDRPASIVKELIENSIDAGANQIEVEIKNGGIKYIKIQDNGAGFASDDVEISFERHATSKIRKEEDLSIVKTMGFRGEALASIAAISKVNLVTKNKDENIGTRAIVEAGNIISVEPCAAIKGTKIEIRDVFFNVPARFKFLKRDATEAGYIEDVVIRTALANPSISFKYINNSKAVIKTSGKGNLEETIYEIFGKEIYENIIPINYEYNQMKISGVIGKQNISRSTRMHQFTYVNNRYIKDKTINSAIDKACLEKYAINKFAFCVVNLAINPSHVDVNVHPSKLEVKFENESDVFSAIYHGVLSAIENQNRKDSPFSTIRYEKIKRDIDLISKDLQNTGVIKNNEVKKEYKYSFDLDNKIKSEGVTNINEPSEEVKYNESNKENIDVKSNNNSGNILEKIDDNINVECKDEDVRDKSVENVESNVSNLCVNVDNKEENKNIEYIEENQSSFFDKKEFPNITVGEKSEILYKYIGQVFDTYIIIQIKDKMYIIDQHAAHERLLFEEFKENYYATSRNVQMLLIPSLINLTSKEKELVINNMEMFEKAGFILEEFGDNTIKISGVPNIGYDIDYKDMIKDIIDELLGAIKTENSEKEHRFLATLACKAAVKGNMKLNKEEQISLIDKMVKLENPFTCPHGRPTAYEISKYEIERRFLRK